MSLESALALIESVKDSKVLFVGETISDEYHYVTPLGKSPKEHIIPFRYESQEVFAGGVVAAAKHAKSFCKVDVCTSNPVRKVRFVDINYKRKLSEVHYGTAGLLFSVPQEGYDAVVVTDFGHGAISNPEQIKAPFLAVAAQTNSSNIGFNLITKYPKADYIVIDEPEARLAAGDRESSIEEVIRKLAKGRCEKFIVTHGHHGAYALEKDRFVQCRSFPNHPVDTMGAGDAFFAVTAPMAKNGSIEDLLLIGHAAGALKCGIFGHRESVTKTALVEFLKAHAPR